MEMKPMYLQGIWCYPYEFLEKELRVRKFKALKRVVGGEFYFIDGQRYIYLSDYLKWKKGI